MESATKSPKSPGRRRTSNRPPWEPIAKLNERIQDQLRITRVKFDVPSIVHHLNETIRWLDVRKDAQEETLLFLCNMGMGYRYMLDVQKDAGSWSEQSQQLHAVWERANALASALENLPNGARILWSHAEKRLGLEESGRGLFPVMHPERMTPPGATKLNEEGEWVPVPTSSLPGVEPPDIHLGTLEIANRLSRVSEWLKEARGQIGTCTVTEVVIGSAELDLFGDIKLGLARLGLDHKKSKALGKRIHHFVTGEKPTPYWGDEAHRRTEAWFAKIHQWVGRESEAPEEVLIRMQSGPATEPPRRQKLGRSHANLG